MGVGTAHLLTKISIFGYQELTQGGSKNKTRQLVAGLKPIRFFDALIFLAIKKQSPSKPRRTNIHGPLQANSIHLALANLYDPEKIATIPI